MTLQTPVVTAGTYDLALSNADQNLTDLGDVTMDALSATTGTFSSWLKADSAYISDGALYVNSVNTSVFSGSIQMAGTKNITWGTPSGSGTEGNFEIYAEAGAQGRLMLSSTGGMVAIIDNDNSATTGSFKIIRDTTVNSADSVYVIANFVENGNIRFNGPLTTFTATLDGGWDIGQHGRPWQNVYTIGTYDTTSASAANVVVETTGRLVRSTSSRRYKTGIRDLPDWAVNKFDELHPVLYRSKDAPYGRPYGGLIAEEVDSVGLGLFVEYGTTGQPEGVMYSHLVALLIAKVQQQEKRIEALEARR